MTAGLQKLPILAPHGLLRGPSPGTEKSQPPLDEYFNSLFTTLGPQHWWPAKSPFEVIVKLINTREVQLTSVQQGREFRK